MSTTLTSLLFCGSKQELVAVTDFLKAMSQGGSCGIGNCSSGNHKAYIWAVCMFRIYITFGGVGAWMWYAFCSPLFLAN